MEGHYIRTLELVPPDIECHTELMFHPRMSVKNYIYDFMDYFLMSMR